MPEPADTAPRIDSSFPHRWQATILGRRPLIAPARHFVYPAEVEEVERGALELMVRPPANGDFLGTFALGFADPSVPTGVWSCPHPDWLCAVAGGYAYLVNTTAPDQWEQVEYRPVLAVASLPKQRLLLFSGHQSLVAYGPNGKAWQTGRLSWEGFKILRIDDQSLIGLGWDMMTDREFEFKVDLATGEHQPA
ncbi:hypothetical protein ACPOL_1461 [Acidisarcina polymorpha]|uniref:Uncharacterized protein n=1 Tax=Acidisarcina polymorpha TaxID=2211140 RepID=A0A2Z5FWA8_9BACT|nr:hypothetical protein [Acidisarcina polymorpha]AXC10807.1 hypothetical protein ACPOL_1461 [Acidisarcina polymorpha]